MRRTWRFSKLTLVVSLLVVAPANIEAQRIASPSGSYDNSFGQRGKQLTDLRSISLSRRPRVSDAVRFVHQRSDGTYLLVGQSQECDTDWNWDLFNDGCRNIVSFILYDRRGIRLPNVGLEIGQRNGFAGYTDGVISGKSGMNYFLQQDIMIDPATHVERQVSPLPNLTTAEDSVLYRDSAFVLIEETGLNPNCEVFEQDHRALNRYGAVCTRARSGAILVADRRLDFDSTILNNSRLALERFVGHNGIGDECNQVRFSSIAVTANRMFIGGHHENRCDRTPVAYDPFVIALTRGGHRDLTFGTQGIWSPAWPGGDKILGSVSDLQIDPSGNLLVLAGRGGAVRARFTTTVLSITPTGAPLSRFGTAGELALEDVQFDPGARNLKLVLASGARAYVFSRFGRQVALINPALGTRDKFYGPASTGVYAAEADVASQPAFAGVPAPLVLLNDVTPVCKNSVALIGSTLEPASRSVAVVLNGSGRRATNVRNQRARQNAGLLFDSFTGVLPHTHQTLGYAGFYDMAERRLLVAGSAGSVQDGSAGGTLPLYDFAVAARTIRCADVD